MGYLNRSDISIFLYYFHPWTENVWDADTWERFVREKDEERKKRLYSVREDWKRREESPYRDVFRAPARSFGRHSFASSADNETESRIEML